MIKHIVLFSFINNCSSFDKDKINERFSQLPADINIIQSFISGPDVSVENKSKGFEQAYILDFNNSKDRDAYLIHPIHKDFSDFARPFLKDVLVIDMKS